MVIIHNMRFFAHFEHFFGKIAAILKKMLVFA